MEITPVVALKSAAVNVETPLVVPFAAALTPLMVPDAVIGLGLAVRPLLARTLVTVPLPPPPPPPVIHRHGGVLPLAAALITCPDVALFWTLLHGLGPCAKHPAAIARNAIASFIVGPLPLPQSLGCYRHLWGPPGRRHYARYRGRSRCRWHPPRWH